MPLKGVIQNVGADAVEGLRVADDVLVIIALPDGCAGRATVFVDAFGTADLNPATNDANERLAGPGRGDRPVAPTVGPVAPTWALGDSTIRTMP